VVGLSAATSLILLERLSSGKTLNSTQKWEQVRVPTRGSASYRCALVALWAAMPNVSPADPRPTDLLSNGSFDLMDKGSNGSHRTRICARWFLVNNQTVVDSLCLTFNPPTPMLLIFILR
jgi:hypothetical protein